MSFKNDILYPCNPAAERGVSTKLSVHKSKVIYTNGRAVIVCAYSLVSIGVLDNKLLSVSSYAI